MKKTMKESKLKRFTNKEIKNTQKVKGGTDGDGTGLTVIVRVRAPRYKGRRGE